MTFVVPSVFKAIDDTTGPLRAMMGSVRIFSQRSVVNIHKVDRAMINVGRSTRDLSGNLQGLAATAGLTLGVDQLFTMQQEFNKTRRTLLQFGVTGRGQLEEISAQVTAVARQFNEDVNPTLVATNALAKGMGIPFAEAANQVESGFVRGLNANNEFLDILREYPALMKEAGLNTEQFMNLIQTSVNQGIFADKGIDVIKEANIRIREMTPATAQAINAIGLSSKELQKGLESGSLQVIDVIQKISKHMKALPPTGAKVGKVLADIFGAPGEDAGLQFILSLQDMSDAASKVPPELLALQKSQRQLLEVNKELNKTLGELFTEGQKEFTQLKIVGLELFISFAKAIKPVLKSTITWISENRELFKNIVTVTAKVFLFLKGLSAIAWVFGKVVFFGEKVVAFFRTFWSVIVAVFNAARVLIPIIAAMAAPFASIIALIVGLVGLVITIIKHWNEWGAGVSVLLGQFSIMISVFQSLREHWQQVVNAFTAGGIQQALKSIMLVLYDAVLTPLEQIAELLAKIPGLGGALEEIRGMRAIIQASLQHLGPEPPIQPQTLPPQSQLPMPGVDPISPLLLNTAPAPATEPNEADTTGLQGAIERLTEVIQDTTNQVPEPGQQALVPQNIPIESKRGFDF